MESKLSIIEFRDRIKNNTVIGNPKFKLVSPFGLFRIFGSISRPFYGDFEDSTFRLTTNSSISPKLYTIKGKYEIINKVLNISYIIEPTHKLSIIWLKYFPIIAFVLANSVLISQENVPFQVYLIFNLFIVFSLFYTRWLPKQEMKNLKRKFNEIFEIII